VSRIQPLAAVVSEHQGTGAGSPPPRAGYVLRMPAEIHDWLTDLRSSDQTAARSHSWRSSIQAPSATSAPTARGRPSPPPPQESQASAGTATISAMSSWRRRTAVNAAVSAGSLALAVGMHS